MRRWRAEDTRLRKRIDAARQRLAQVRTPDESLLDTSGLCLALGADGLRGRAWAACDGAGQVGRDQIAAVAPPALPCRLRRDPLDEAGSTARIAPALDHRFGAFRTTEE